MNRYGYFYGNAGRRKFRMFFSDAFTRNLYAAADRSLGFRVRCFEIKPAAPAYYGA